MYTATMIYPVKNESMEEFINLWEDMILNQAIRQPGFVHMQLLTRDAQAMAIGCWTEKKYAEEFMALGPFKKLMDEVERFLTDKPKPTIWTQSAYASR